MVTAASVVSRPMENSLNLITHYGVVLVTNQGDWLIHATPGDGVVVTSAQNMSNKWSVDSSIAVRSGKTIRGCLEASNGAISQLPCIVNYVNSETCIGCKNAVRAYLER